VRLRRALYVQIVIDYSIISIIIITTTTTTTIIIIIIVITYCTYRLIGYNLHNRHVMYLQIFVTYIMVYLHVYVLCLSFADCKAKIAAFQVTTSTVKYYDLGRSFPKRF
jgi:hypothetical protein